MSGCTAPVNGHRTESGRANCPVCGRYGYGNRYRYARYEPILPGYSNRSSGNSTSNKGDRRMIHKASWSPYNSSLRYSPEQIRTLTPYRETFVKRSSDGTIPKDVFLCHAWDDRKGLAHDLAELIDQKGVSVWFSEKDVPLGCDLIREIDKGLANSKIGIVLVTPAFVERIRKEGIAGKELSALLHKDLLIPVLHDMTFEKLYEVSPLLASRSGLSTGEDTLDIIASRIAELTTIG